MKQNNRKWFRGDFHLHCSASTARYSPLELVGLAIKEGCDFIAITDHNTIAAVDELRSQDQLLVVPGIEITLEEGHWNVFGVNGWQEWMKEINTGEISTTLKGKPVTIGALMKTLGQFGYFISLNHPFLEPWHWQDGSIEMQGVHGIEIWNDPYWPDNLTATPKAIQFWTKTLNKGYRITALGGSDFHLLPGDQPGYPGEKPSLPATYVLAEELTTSAILEGIRNHRVYLARDVRCSLTASINGQVFDIGEDCGMVNGEIEFHVSLTKCEQKTQVRLIKEGEVIRNWNIQQTGLEDSMRDQPCGKPTWYRMEAWSETDELVAITNPIYCGKMNSTTKALFHDFL